MDGETRWLDADEHAAWVSLLATVSLLEAALDRQLQRDSGMPHAYYQILAMLSYYLGHDRKEGGRLVVTQTGLPVIEAIAQHFPNIERPAKGVLHSTSSTNTVHSRMPRTTRSLA